MHPFEVNPSDLDVAHPLHQALVRAAVEEVAPHHAHARVLQPPQQLRHAVAARAQQRVLLHVQPDAVGL